MTARRDMDRPESVRGYCGSATMDRMVVSCEAVFTGRF